ncbi:unnamed protein product [Symbiodinium sp. CCMP2456]|nr:unnamed protein product [Symbiodinium sp. CCMP2456]
MADMELESGSAQSKSTSTPQERRGSVVMVRVRHDLLNPLPRLAAGCPGRLEWPLPHNKTHPLLFIQGAPPELWRLREAFSESRAAFRKCLPFVIAMSISEFSRIALAIAGYAVAYIYSAQGHDEDAARLLQLGLSVALSGTCALEGICFYETAARQKGYDRGFDFSAGRNPYATQSTLWFASSCIVGVVAFFAYPRESSAQIVLATLQLLFFLMSALNHVYETVSHGNWRWQNVNRPLLSVAMVAGAVSQQESKALFWLQRHMSLVPRPHSATTGPTPLSLWTLSPEVPILLKASEA